jgi:U-box domain/C2 domain
MADSSLPPFPHSNSENDQTDAQENIDESCYEDLNLTFDDMYSEDDDALLQNLSLGNNNAVVDRSAPAVSVPWDNGDALKKEDFCSYGYHYTASAANEEYILGTLIVRVVAARDLEPVHKNTLGNLLFGNGIKNSSGGGGGGSGGIGNSRSRSKGGTANPYASVRLGATTQRTSEAYETTDPIWSRGEAMYMDVTHSPVVVVVVENDGPAPLDGTTTTTTTSTHAPSENKENATKTTTEVCHPGDPPKKAHSKDTSESTGSTTTTVDAAISEPILTVAIFHASEVGRLSKFPDKKNGGDSDDVFLGMTSIDLTQVLTGKRRTFDEWLPLQGTLNSAKSSVRIVCEYESSDSPPFPGDVVKFTDYCRTMDLYPAVATGRVYTVQEVNGDDVLISWTSGEGWMSTFLVHRFMLICVERHHSVVDLCQDELASIRERIAYSPMVHVVQQSVERIPDDGLLTIGAEAVRNGASLLSRWWENGLETTARDLSFATNWDGRHNPSASDSLATSSLDVDEVLTEPSTMPQSHNDPHYPTSITASAVSGVDSSRLALEQPLPNMPPCPITGESMRDPVVAADGHTYERSAIARWLTESNKSPLTGAILSHKDLVPNYMLLSRLREALSAMPSSSPESNTNEGNLGAIGVEEDEEGTAEVNIND